uniref:Uncharacterized protein n=1 Tax=Megaselia scalaris TaxID=36166 RepID=T1GG58_MEGSC
MSRIQKRKGIHGYRRHGQRDQNIDLENNVHPRLEHIFISKKCNLPTFKHQLITNRPLQKNLIYGLSICVLIHQDICVLRDFVLKGEKVFDS